MGEALGEGGGTLAWPQRPEEVGVQRERAPGTAAVEGGAVPTKVFMMQEVLEAGAALGVVAEGGEVTFPLLLTWGVQASSEEGPGG